MTGPFAYVSGSNVFTIVDIHNPVSPSKLSTTPAPTGAGEFVSCRRQIDFAYCAMGAGGLAIYNVANPVLPILNGTLHELGNGSASRLEVSGTNCYLANGSEGIWMVDVTNPIAPVILESYHGTGVVGDVSLLSAGVLFAAGGVQGMIALAAPAAPVTLRILRQTEAVTLAFDPQYSGTRLEMSEDLIRWQDAGDENLKTQPVPQGINVQRFFRVKSGQATK